MDQAWSAVMAVTTIGYLMLTAAVGAAYYFSFTVSLPVWLAVPAALVLAIPLGGIAGALIPGFGDWDLRRRRAAQWRETLSTEAPTLALWAIAAVASYVGFRADSPAWLGVVAGSIVVVLFLLLPVIAFGFMAAITEDAKP